VNGLVPYGDIAALITVTEILRALQAETIAFSETNVEWHTFQLGDNMQKLFTKAFGTTRMKYRESENRLTVFCHSRFLNDVPRSLFTRHVSRP
jgi:hypothetical protein